MTARDAGHMVRRLRFRPDEDLLLANLVARYGVNAWRRVAAGIPGRNYRQCRDRWNHYISKARPTHPSRREWPQFQQRAQVQLTPDDFGRIMMPDVQNSIGTRTAVSPQGGDTGGGEPPWEQSDPFQAPSEGDAPFDAFFKEFMNTRNRDQT
jgi:hypothetical protein